MQSRPMATVLTCTDIVEAEFLKAFLNNHGIQADLSNNRPGWTGRYSAMRGIRLEVPTQELAQAKALLKEAESGAFALSEEELAAVAEDGEEVQMGPYRPEACPGCGSANVLEVKRGGMLFWVFNLCFLGLPWLLSPTSWGCKDCGWEWTQQDLLRMDEKEDR